MNILYIGGGFVGACSAAVCADSGHQTLVFDISQERIEKLGSEDRAIIESCLFEEGLGDLLVRNKERISFTSNYSKVEKFLADCDAVFMCLPTPEIGETGESDLSFYFDAANKLAKALVKRNNRTQEKYLVIVNKSTVPIGMVDITAEIMKKNGVKNFGVVSNPEFLVEGKAVEGSIRPDRVVIGASAEKDFLLMRQLYQRFYSASGIEYIEVSPQEAAAGKLLANFYLFSKLAVCFDVIGRVSEAFPGVSFEKIRQILTTDPRIGKWGFYDSLYAGGSCFIKDSRSLAHQLKQAKQNSGLVNEVYLANKRQLKLFMERAESEAKFSWENKTVALLGLAFKQDTNDIRNSPSLEIVKLLHERGVKSVRLFDPAASNYFKTVFKPDGVNVYVSDEVEALVGAEAVIIATDWPQFRGVADKMLAVKGTKPLIMDGRRLWQHRYQELQAAGFSIIAVGSPFMRQKSSKR